MDNNKNKDSFLKGALILGAAGVVVKIMGAFFRIPLGNLIGSTGMGYYQAVYPVYTLFLTLATAGFPTALAKLVSEKRAIGDYGGAAKTFRVASTVLFLTGLVSFCIFYFGADFIVNGIMKNEGALASMKAIAPALLFVPLMSSFRGYFQGRREMSKIAISQMVEQFFRVVLGIAIAYYWMVSFGPEQGAAGGVLGAAIGGFASIVFLILAYLRTSKERRAELELSKNFRVESTKTVLKRILYVAVPITIGACVMPLVNMVDSIVVVRRLQETGFDVDTANSLLGQLTGMAMATVNLPVFIDQAIGMSLVPSISEAYALNQRGRVKKEARNGIKLILIIVLPCAFGLAALATPIMSLLYPSETGAIGKMLFACAPSAIFLGLIYAQNGILQGMGKPMVPVIALAIGMVFKVILSYTLTGIPSINIFGSAIGTLTAYAVAALIEFLYIIYKRNLEQQILDSIKHLKDNVEMTTLDVLTERGKSGINILITLLILGLITNFNWSIVISFIVVFLFTIKDIYSNIK